MRQHALGKEQRAVGARAVGEAYVDTRRPHAQCGQEFFGDLLGCACDSIRFDRAHFAAGLELGQFTLVLSDQDLRGDDLDNGSVVATNVAAVLLQHRLLVGIGFGRLEDVVPPVGMFGDNAAIGSVRRPHLP